jgi:hypothetical protein
LNDVVYGTRNGAVETSWPVAARGREALDYGLRAADYQPRDASIR